ncbi:anti-sigma factor [Novosphingobium sp.]|uniref:anti-sigma factor n=1 Tax=Novosphingobium sp. TaxID=1874826 RepID=UPI003341646D
MTTTRSDHDDDDLLAAELALGLLDPADAARATARLASDPDFARAHDRWLTYAAGLTASVPETAPPPQVWAAIADALPANDDAPATGWLARAGVWQAATLAASLAALVMGFAVWQRSAPPPVPNVVAPAAAPPLVAVLSGTAGVVSVAYDPGSGRLASVVSGIADPARAVELWVIPADGRPRSLGLLARDRPGWRVAPGSAAQALRAGVVLAVSLEPAGGSPTGLPTGPVILTGKLQQAG